MALAVGTSEYVAYLSANIWTMRYPAYFGLYRGLRITALLCNFSVSFKHFERCTRYASISRHMLVSLCWSGIASSCSMTGGRSCWRQRCVFLSSLAAVNLFTRAPALPDTRLAWLITAGAVTGFGTWATHFIAMLAYSWFRTPLRPHHHRLFARRLCSDDHGQDPPSRCLIEPNGTRWPAAR